MTIHELVLALSVGLLSLAAVGVGIAAAWRSSRRTDDRGSAADARGLATPGALDDPRSGGDAELMAPRRATRDRAVRVVALSYLVAVAVAVAVSDGWGADAATIYLLVALGTLAVVFLGDLVPDTVPSLVRAWAEGLVAILLVTAITGLTGGLLSPFAAGFFLIVGAGAMSRDSLAPIAVATVSAFAAAAVDLLVWPRTADGIPVSVLAAVGFLAASLVLLGIIMAVVTREHRRAQDHTLRLARFDPLTGLYNRTHFLSELEREIRLSQRAGRTFALLMLDVDGLKPVNDAYGHHYGDRLLMGVTSVIRSTVRATDTPARYGGDEFLVLLPETDAAGAYVVAEKLRHDIAAFSIQISDRTVRTSVSVGLVAYPEDGTTVDALMASADAALYEAKRTGRDRIVGYTTRMERVTTRMGTERRVTVGPTEPPVPGSPSEPAASVSGPSGDLMSAAEPGPGPVRPVAPAPGSASGSGSAPTSEPLRPATPWPPPSTPPSTPPVPPSTPPASPSTVTRSAGRAPWETGTNADWETRGRARVAMPVGAGGEVGSDDT